MKDFNELLKVGKAAFDTMYQGVGTLAVWFSVAILLVLAASVALATMKNRANFAVAMLPRKDGVGQCFPYRGKWHGVPIEVMYESFKL